MITVESGDKVAVRLMKSERTQDDNSYEKCQEAALPHVSLATGMGRLEPSLATVVGPPGLVAPIVVAFHLQRVRRRA